MKVKLSYEFTHDEDGSPENAARRVMSASGFSFVCYGMAMHLRSILKHQELEDNEHEIVEGISKAFWDLCSENGVDPYEA